jgi:hypothetical protein
LNRDHHATLIQLIARHEPEPIDESARAALLDPEYGKGLEHYGELYENLSESIWHEQYLQDQRQKEFHVKGS